MLDFNLNEPGTFKVQNAQENEFINDKASEADRAKYGLTYWVKFEGNAETFLWTAKTAPEEGKEYYGHIQATSGKSLRFKVDKQEDGDHHETTTSKPAYKDNSKSITLGLVWKILIGIQGVPEDDEQFAKFFETVNMHVSELLSMGEKLNNE